MVAETHLYSSALSVRIVSFFVLNIENVITNYIVLIAVCIRVNRT